MSNQTNGFVDKEGWVHCPICGNKTRTKIRADTVLKNFPLYCPKCGYESIVDIEKMNIVTLEPDARRRAGNL